MGGSAGGGQAMRMRAEHVLRERPVYTARKLHAEPTFPPLARATLEKPSSSRGQSTGICIALGDSIVENFFSRIFAQ